MTYKTTYWDTESKSQKERDCTPEEVAEIEQRKIDGATVAVNAPVLSAITALESTVTPRRIREAVTTDAGKTWLVAVDSQIAALRGSLVK